MGLNFKFVFTEKSTCESREQCTRPTKKMLIAGKRRRTVFQCYPNGY